LVDPNVAVIVDGAIALVVGCGNAYIRIFLTTMPIATPARVADAAEEKAWLANGGE
jgi:hypothetical protein